MANGKLLVTGATGQLGQRVLALLTSASQREIVATTRKPGAALARPGVQLRAADFDRPETLLDAFAGVERALLISTDEVLVPGRRQRQHENAVRALERAGIQHVVYTSLPNPAQSSVTIAPDHAFTEQLLQASQLGFTLLRNNLYADLLLQTLPQAIASGKLIDARADGAVAYVTREDCARTAAAALLDREGPSRSIEDVTGPEALSSARLAALVSERVGRPIEHVAVSASELASSLRQHGLPAPLAALYASFDTAIARGELSHVSETVQRRTGRPATALAAYLESALA